jgi:hypothetical protein
VEAVTAVLLGVNAALSLASVTCGALVLRSARRAPAVVVRSNRCSWCRKPLRGEHGPVHAACLPALDELAAPADWPR